jgi:hypothetical protein
MQAYGADKIQHQMNREDLLMSRCKSQVQVVQYAHTRQFNRGGFKDEVQHGLKIDVTPLRAF